MAARPVQARASPYPEVFPEVVEARVSGYHVPRVRYRLRIGKDRRGMMFGAYEEDRNALRVKEYKTCVVG
jgi:hypothetical protein